MNKTSLFAIIVFCFLFLSGCNQSNKSQIDDDVAKGNTTSKSEISPTENSSQKNLTVEEINQNILNTYIDGVFEIEKELDNPIRYHENGLISDIHLCTRETNNSICIYKNSQHEKGISFYENGKLSHLSERMGGKYHGQQIDYWENGQIQHEVLYHYGNKQGEEISYFMDGTVFLKWNYKNGEKDGNFYCYYPNGKLKETAEYSNGIKGNSIRYFENGKEEYKCTNENDFRICNGYFENGKLKSERKENLKTKISSETEYDENGKITNQEYHDEEGNQITDNSIIENFNQ